MSTTHRVTVAFALAACAVMTVVSIPLAPSFEGDHADRLAAIAAAPTASLVSALLFTLAQLPFAVGLVGVAVLTGRRAPRLSFVAAVLAALGGFGHAVHGGVSITMLGMAEDPNRYDVYGDLLAAGESGAMIPFLVAGLVGTVLGVILTGVAVWRAKLGPRWLGPVLVGFVLVEFGGSALSDWAFYASGGLYFLGLVTLAAAVLREQPGSVAHEPAADARMASTAG